MECNNDNGGAVVAVHNCPPPHHDLLDSSLIVTTSREVYNIKLINCNDYVQIYYLKNTHSRKKEGLEKNVINNKHTLLNINTDELIKKENINNRKIELKNIIRSKLECQRLAKCNAKIWKTFITLTFEENITNIKTANKKFRNFIDKVKRVFKDFCYIGIPEFQKRGAAHYHLLTNISIDDERLIYSQVDNTKFKHIKYWNEGYNKVDILENDIKKIVGYISKYMTKDVDNRLFNCHRYFYSRNLKKPNISYLDLTNKRHLEYYNKILNNKNLIYENSYINPYDNELVEFKEFL